MSMTIEVKEYPEFASLCSFIHLFGEDVNIHLTHNQLASFLEVKNNECIPKPWIDVHRGLLNRVKFHCPSAKWESILKRFLISIVGCESDLVECNYCDLSPHQRSKILNILFDTQFDRNAKFKEKVNTKDIDELRMKPFGIDIYGYIYWLFVDREVNVLMYKENLEEESFKIVAKTVEEMRLLKEEIQNVDVDNVELSKLYICSNQPDENDSPTNNGSEIAIKDETSLKKNLSVKESTIKAANSNSIKSSFAINGICDLLNDKPGNCKTVKQVGNRLEVSSDSEDETTVGNTKLVIDIMDQATHLVKPNTTNENELMNDDNNLNGNAFSNIKIEKNFGCLENEIILKKKPGRKQKKFSEKRNTEPLVQSDEVTGLRRSSRQRKPINLFTISHPVGSKKVKIESINHEENEDIEKLKKSRKERRDKKREKNKGKGKRNKFKRSKKFSDDKKKSKDKKKLKKMKKKHKGKHKGHKKLPWETAETTEDEVGEDDEEDYMYMNDESDSSLSLDKNDEDWDDKPESDFDPDKLSLSSDEETSKARGRNYFLHKKRALREKVEATDDKPCQICLGSTIPEMILLCDSCDFGHHAMCLRPSLMIIPEGDWFCPKCQHKKLLACLTEKISEIEKSQAKSQAKMRMQERLNFVNISMSNLLSNNRTRKPARAYYKSEESFSDKSSSSPSLSSSSGSYDSSEDSDSKSDSNRKPHGRYKFRESSRKDNNNKYKFEELDRMFDEALIYDEKYQMEKKRIDVKEFEEEEKKEESEPEYDYSGLVPRKKSSGKDLSNLLREEKPILQKATKRKRFTCESDDEEFADDLKDADYRVSDDCTTEEDESINNEEDNSDDDWIASYKSRKKSSRKKNKYKKYFGTSLRPRRSVAKYVNYREMVGEDDEDEDFQPENSPDYVSSDESDDNKPPPVVPRNGGRVKYRPRIMSDSEYEQSSHSTKSNEESGSTEKLETVNKKKKRNEFDSEDESDAENGIQRKIQKIESFSSDPLPQSKESEPKTLEPKPPKPLNNFNEIHNLSLSIKNPMRANEDDDNNVEDEVESETECEMTSLKR